MNGWTPTITAETQRRNELNTCIVFLAQSPDNKYWQNRLACVRDAIDADKLAELIDLCNTDPAHIARVSDDYTETLEHMTNAAYMDASEYHAQRAADFEAWRNSPEEIAHREKRAAEWRDWKSRYPKTSPYHFGGTDVDQACKGGDDNMPF